MASACPIPCALRCIAALLVATEVVFDAAALREHEVTLPSELQVPVDQSQAVSIAKDDVGYGQAGNLRKEIQHDTQTSLVTGSAESTNTTMPRIVKGEVVALAQIGPPEWRIRITDLGKHLFTGISIAVFVKVACLFGNILVQVSPMPQVQEWTGKGTTGSAEPAPCVAMALGGYQWCTYGVAAWMLSSNDGFLVLVYANCLGALLGCYYTFAFYRNCSNDSAKQNLKRYLIAVFFLIVVQSFMWLLFLHPLALTVHSFIAGGCSFISAASLLTSLPAVFRTGDTSGICSPLILANFVGAFLWAYWGMIMGDFVVIAANMFAAMSSAICLYAKFLRRESDAPKAKEQSAWVAFHTRAKEPDASAAP